MNKIEYGTEFLDQLKDRVHDLYDKNKELLSSNVRLREEKIKLKSIINKAIEYIENCHGMYRNTIGDIQPMINIKPVLDILKEGEKE